ncbi:arginase family protein [Streptomyces somaliensis DSM 40738]|uniref:Arginase family protein n=1 Tax=Streptomyces somaliensis (strain ATCC 33201 / DSM 40738 / JCM 12659 / KCTC 9044 / NCTC 11332 / NRRL B-12077 / IP 733) TaxID=1134445 RepID=A0AA44D9Y8_STRE0|nr:arginase family protein [Streptomyces somaliensis]MCQ0024274.1 arginase family protein [Streptomyces somaliensis DSM 40738]NKY12886.1 arginase family protein [Streptomyces somaliensis DSM 40738]
MIDLIVSQGRVADRAPRMIEGAARIAEALEHRYGLKGHRVGEPAPAADDDWSVSLPQARETLLGLEEAVTASTRAGNLTVMVSNTCSASLATLPVVAREHPDAVLLYVDAHGDFNTPETTGTGYLGGMVLSAACGLWDSGHGAGLRPEQAVLVGARDIDEAEGELLRKAGVRIIPPRETTAENILDAVGESPVWVHVDWDVLEPGHVPADYTVPDGLLPEQIRMVFETVPSARLRGVELAEFNAPADPEVTEQAVSTILSMVAPAFRTAQAG